MTIFYVHLFLLIWGFSFIAVKIQGTPVSLELSLTYRLFLTAILFSILVWIMKPKEKPSKENLPYPLVFGICNFALSYLCLYYATMFSSAAIATLIFSLNVIFTSVALRIFLKEHLHIRILIGGILGVLGFLILLYLTLHDIHPNDVKGIVLALLDTAITAIGGAKSSYMVALFPAIGGIASVLIGESNPSMYLILGCLSSCIGAAVALGAGTYFRKTLSQKKLSVRARLK